MRLAPPGTPESDLAACLAAQLQGMLPPHSAPGLRQATAQLGLRLSQALAAGHTCLSSTTGLPLPAWQDCGLLGGPDEGPPGGPASPLVLDPQGRVYLRRHYRLERRLATMLATRRTQHKLPPTATLNSWLKPLIDKAQVNQEQALALALASVQALTIISGGPGTGKTTTVAQLLAALVAQDAQLRIALAAPTGKAAARMLQALRERTADASPELLSRLPEQAYTVHRLLGVDADGRFRHHREAPLAVDVLVVDEASMLDLALATQLFEALPGTARLILLGDKDQLAAVEAGAVFAELSAQQAFSAPLLRWLGKICSGPSLKASASDSTALADQVVWLNQSHRFASDSGIGRLARAIRDSDIPTLGQILHQTERDLEWIAGTSADEDLGPRLRLAFEPYFTALTRALGSTDDTAISTVFTAFERFRILCAMREGPRGTDSINAWMTRQLRARLPHPANGTLHGAWFVGRPVMILRNDYTLGLFNGDIGLCLPDAHDKLQVLFPEPGGFRSFSPLRLPAVDSAFAMTIHKAQGSEFNEICLLLPERDHPLLTRELLYTGLTRARRHALIVSSEAVLATASMRRTQRASGLLERLHEALHPQLSLGF